ncbi:MAG TPA: flagellar basal body L-ring protein FlgH [Candidatus Binatia bacterium]|nr:flagellar basal body L-ring protein FlgH [Candidatus Binatia bacterium]
MRTIAAVVFAAALAGCQIPPTAELPPPPLDTGPPPPAPGLGSIWHPEVTANYPATDVRAHFAGELLTVVVQEVSKGTKDASTDTSSQSSITAQVLGFFGIPAASFLPSGFDASNIIDSSTQHAAKGSGTIKRDGTLTGNVTATVVAVDAHGNLRIQGQKVVTVNHEDEYLVLSGTVRPEDILSDNSVPSTRVADAHISYFGRGTAGDKENVPIVHRLMDWVWPF